MPCFEEEENGTGEITARRRTVSFGRTEVFKEGVSHLSAGENDKLGEGAGVLKSRADLGREKNGASSIPVTVTPSSDLVEVPDARRQPTKQALVGGSSRSGLLGGENVEEEPNGGHLSSKRSEADAPDAPASAGRSGA